jgi:hypothetical protein
LGVPSGSLPFTLSFFHDVLDDDVYHIDALPRLGDVQMALGFSLVILFEGFITFFIFFLSFPNFQHQLISFYSTFIHVFDTFLGPCFLDCSKAPLIHWQDFLPISKCEIGIDFAEVITLTSYLGS